ncbi:PKD domain-containing protein [Reichenbachiella agarivorans]|uniref:PKD domain-containing protein n=1 Tax=Reichenbachiella agarivorans TaxID=2979464 RepID=A0ABY6CMN5_9BACT|nr:PKD domain-containing protein [Reichenbachiella agarivorans]UXP31766.1 PKD domain-containing protein [Reichenbachiella agarivorans]
MTKPLILLLLVLQVFSVFSQSAEFTTDLTNNENCGPTSVNFQIVDPTGITLYDWDFGNGEIHGTTANPGTTYLNPGIYTVTLVINGGAETSVQTITIFAEPEPEFVVVDNGGNSCINSTFDVEFDYTGQVPVGGGEIVQWQWDFGNTKPPTTLLASEGNNGDITYTYDSYGTYNVVVAVLDINGCEEAYFLPSAVKIYPEPVSDFDIDYAEDCNFPLDLVLTNTSTDPLSSISQYQWTVTNTANSTVLKTSTEENPTITLPSASDYEISLKVINSPGNCSNTSTQSVSFVPNTASFTTDKTEICIGETVAFTDTSVDGLGGTPTEYTWDFGDGSSSSEASPTHTYASAAGSPYTVSLEVVFSNGCQETNTQTDLVTVVNTGTPAITVSQDELCDREEITFTATAGGTNYIWDFDYDGMTPDFDQQSANNTVSYLYINEGIYDVFLRIVNAQGCIAETIYSSIKVEFPQPEIEFIDGQDGCVGVVGNFSAAGSTNNLPTGSNAIINYSWDFDGNGSIDQSSASSEAVNIPYNSEGIFDIELTIETEDGCTASILYEDSVSRGYAPTASFDASKTTECVDTGISFTNSSTLNGLSTFPIDSVIWDFGDGTVVSGDPTTNPGLNNPSHAYSDDTEDGSPAIGYTVSLTVFSNGCESNVATENIIITYPVARFNYPDLGQCFANNELIFTAINGSSLSEGVDQYRWDFGDGVLEPGPSSSDYTIGSDPSTTHMYERFGDYTVTLYVKNNTSGCEDSFSALIPVTFGIPNFTATDTEVCYGTDQVRFVNLSVSVSSTPTYTWDFGDGANPATFEGSSPPRVIYDTPGLKEVTLTMDESNGCPQKSITKTDFIDVRGPLVDFSISSDNADPNVQCLDTEENLTFQSTSTANGNTNINWLWNFGEGANPATTNANNENPIDVTYGTPGLKTVSLTVTDDGGCVITEAKEDEIIIPNPVADFKIEDGNKCTTETIQFTNQSTTSGLSNLVSWEWDFGADATPATFSGETPGSVVYSTIGTKTISLTVTNANGCMDIYTEDVIIYEANASFPAINEAGCAPVEVTFTDTSVDAVAWLWEFGDNFNSTSTDQNPVFNYVYPGTYDVTLTTTSAGGCEETITQIAAVIVDGPQYDDFSYTINQPCIGTSPQPEATFTITGLEDTKILRLDFGDGTTIYETTFIDPLNPNGGNPVVVSHTYAVLGTFKPKLTLEDDPANVEACGAFVFVPEVPDLIISQNPEPHFTSSSVNSESCENVNISFQDQTQQDGGLIDSRYAITDWLWDFGDGATSTTQNPSHTYAAAGDYEVSLTITTQLGCIGTATQSIVIVGELADDTPPASTTICAGQTPTLDANIPTGGETADPYIYLWQTSSNQSTWSAAAGTNDQEDYQVQASSPSDQNTSYYRRKTQSLNCVVYSGTFTVITDPETLPGTLSSDTDECYGSNNGTLTLNTYRGSVVDWESDTDIAFGSPTSLGNTASTYDYSNLVQTTYFRAQVQSGVCSAQYSNTVTITIQDEIVGNTIDSDIDECSDTDPGTISATAVSGGAGAGTYSYQWQQSSDDSNFSDISGATSETYSPGILTTTMYYRRVVSSIGAITCSNTSASMAINITQAPKTDLTVTADPVCDDEDALIVIANSEDGYSYEILDTDNSNNVVATGTGNGGNLSISIPEASLPNGESTFNFIVEATNGICVRDFPLNSLDINAIPDLGLDVNDAGDVCNGNDGEVTIVNAQTGYFYEVQDTDNGNTTVASGTGAATDLDLSIPSAALPGSGTFHYRIAVQNGACGKILSETGSFDIIPTPDNSLAVSDPVVCEETLPRNIDIIVSNTVSGVNYQLREDLGDINVGAAQEGTNGDLTFTIAAPEVTTIYNVLATAVPLDGTGSSCQGIELSNKSTVTIIPIPNLDYTLSDPTVCENENADVELSNSDLDVLYTIQLEGGAAATGPVTQLEGTGTSLTFTVTTTGNQNYQVSAQSTITGDDGLCNTFVLNDLGIVSVVPKPETGAGLVINDFEYCEEATPSDLVFSVSNSELDVNYSIKAQGDPGYIQTGLAGNGGKINFDPISAPTVTTIYEVYATAAPLADAGSCPDYLLVDQGIVTVAPIPSEKTLSDPFICIGDGGTITLTDSEPNVEYQLMLSDESLVGLPQAGTGSDLSFAISIVTNTQFKVRATSTLIPNCASIVLTDVSNATVIPRPDASVGFSASTQNTCEGEVITFTIDTQADVNYQVQKNDVDFGSVIEGDGTSLEFMDSPSASSVYSVIATPATQDSNGSLCGEVELTKSIGVIIVGPIVFDEQPVDQTLCSGTSTHFSALVSNEGDGGTPELQWQVSTDGISFSDLSEGGVYAGTQTENLVITNTTGLDGNTYHLIATLGSCSETSDPAVLNTAAIPDLTAFETVVDDICLGEDAQVTVTGLADGLYNFTYKVTISNTVTARVASNITATGGTATFSVAANLITNPGNNSFFITKVDYATGQGCGVSSLAEDNFIIFPLPITSGMSIVADDICHGSDATVDLLGNLVDGSYTLTYDLTGNNTATGLTAVVATVGGESSFVISSTNLTNTGTTGIAIKKVQYTTDQLCATTQVNANTQFDIISSPNSSTPMMDDIVICEGNSGIIVLHNSEVGVNYQLRNDSDNSEIGLPQPGNGADINFQVMPSAATTYNVWATSSLIGATCSGVELTSTAEASIIDTPNADLEVLSSTNSACYGDDATITIADTELGVNYQLQANGVNVDGFVITGNGTDQSFSGVPSTSAVYTVIATPNTLDSDLLACNSVQLLDAIPIQVQGPIVINTQPKNITICSDEESVSFSAEVVNNGDGGTPIYKWQSSPDNSTFQDINDGLVYQSTQTQTLQILDNAGLDGTYYRLSISTSQCQLYTDAALLTITGLPDVDNLSLSTANICVSQDLIVDFTSDLLEDEKYLFVYTLTGSNYYGPEEIEVTVSSGNGSGTFVIPSEQITKKGPTILTITEVDFTTGQECSVFGLNVTSVFQVEPNPNVNNVLLDASDVCFGADAEIVVTGSLADGSYVVSYDLSGANTAVAQTTSLVITSGTGMALIPAAQLTNTGNTTFNFLSASNDSGENCLSTKNANTSFNVLNDPVLASEALTAPQVCMGETVSIDLTGYQTGFDYYLERDSDNQAVSSVLSDADAVGSILTFDINPTPLTTTTYNLIAYANQSVVNCSAVNLLSTTATVVPVPATHTIDVEVDKNALCAGETVTISLDNADATVSYQLQANKINVAGAVIAGLSGAQAFPAQSPTSSTVYRVTATPYVGGSTTCDVHLLADTESVVVEGPVTFDTQPVSASTCDGEDIQFTAVVSNPSGTTVYQWQESTNGGSTFNNLTNGVIYQNVDTQILTIADVTGLDGNLYRLNVTTAECDFNSDQAELSTFPTPNATTVALSSSDICQGQDATIGISGTLIDGRYTINYSVTGAGTNNHVQIVTFSSGDGTANLVIPTAQIPDVDSYSVDINTIGYDFGSCGQSPTTAPTVFEVEAVPDVTNFAINIDDICNDVNATVTITGSSLSNNIFDVNYTLSGENTGSFTSQASIDGSGNGSFDILESNLPNEGTTVVTVNSVAATNGQSCAVTGLNAIADFYIAPDPNISNPKLTDPFVCQGDDTVIKMTNSEVDVSYQLRNDAGDANVGSPVIGTGGTITFATISSLGSTTVYNVLATPSGGFGTCVNSLEITDKATATVISTPIDKTIVSNEPETCSGDLVAITVQATENNVRYELFNDLTGTAIAGQVFLGNGADQSFNDSPLDNIVYQIKATPNQLNSNNVSCATEIMTDNPVVVVDGPIEITTQPTDQYTCDDNVSISVVANNLGAGTLSYQWYQGALALSNSGDYTGINTSQLNIGAASSHDGEQYSVVVTIGTECTLSSDVVTLYSRTAPDATDLATSTADICLGSKAKVNVTSQLTAGTYTFTYKLNGANTSSGNHVNATVNSSGNTFFLVPESLLTNTGITVATITDVNYTAGMECITSGLSATSAFAVQSIPNTTNFDMDIANVCLQENATVDISSELANGDYLLSYTLSDANVGNYTSAIRINSGDGSGVLTIPSSQLSNPGSTTLKVTQINNDGGQNCAITDNNGIAESSFEVEEIPVVADLSVQVNNICQGENATIQISSTLPASDYQLYYTLYGSNAVAGSQTVTFAADGSASMQVEASKLSTPGEMTFVLTTVAKINGNLCRVSSLGMADKFTIEDLPVISGMALLTNNTCEGEATTVTLTSNLINGTYEITYQLLGSNVVAQTTAIGSVSAGNGNVNIPLPASYVVNPGLTTIDISHIRFTDGKLCGQDVNVQGTLEILEKPYPINTQISIDNVCAGSDATAVVTSSSLKEGQYKVTYNITGPINSYAQTDIIDVVAGNSSFEIEENLISQVGDYLISFTQINYTSDLACEVNILSNSTAFAVNDSPDLSALALTVESPICRNNAPSLILSGLEASTSYTIMYDNNGVIESSSILTDASGSATVPTNAITQDAHYKIISVAYSDGDTNCATFINMTAVTSDVGCRPISQNASVDGLEDNLTVFTNADFYFEDPDGDAFKGVVIVTLPTKGLLFYSGVVVTASDVVTATAYPNRALFRYLPKFDGNGSPFDSFTFKVKDDSNDPNTELSASAYTMEINIAKVEDAPEVANVIKNTDEETTLTFSTADFTSNFTDLENEPLTTIRFESIPTAFEGSLQLGAGAIGVNQEIPVAQIPQITFTPTTNFNGQVRFKWNGSDGTYYANDAADVIIVVNPVNDAPIAIDDAYNLKLTQSNYISGDVSINDSDPEGDPMIFQVIIQPLNGVVTMDANGSFTYTPNQGYNGEDSFTYEVCDNPPAPLSSLCSQAMVDIAILATLLDSDDDGILDIIEVGPDPSNPLDTDGDGAPDYLDKDADNDGIADFFEYKNTDFGITGRILSTENILIPLDSDGDGVPDYLDTDSDNDNVPDMIESGNQLPSGVDADGNGIDDVYDVPDGSFTNSLSRDPRDTDVDGIRDYVDIDDDNDSILTKLESVDGDTDPTNDDTDGDSLANYLDTDDDGDNVPTILEDIDGDGSPLDDDSDKDGLVNYLDNDDDGDWVLTINEDINTTGRLVEATYPWFNADGVTWAQADGDPTNDDTDADGIPNYLDTDDDGDGIPTQLEDINGNQNPQDDDEDKDTKPNYLDDSDDEDGDGKPDIEECDQEASNGEGLPCDCDGDGIPNFIDAFDDCDGPLLVIPNVFTPNGDGSNDTWRIPLIDNDGADGSTNYSNNEVQVFNRWGTKVYEGKNYNNESVVWDGTANTGLGSGGKELPDGTYFYYITIQGESEILSGFVVIKR